MPASPTTTRAAMLLVKKTITPFCYNDKVSDIVITFVRIFVLHSLHKPNLTAHVTQYYLCYMSTKAVIWAIKTRR